jgi:catechol 2,3-dioxygenase-like lactoylglutathione lyase family enzyme
MFGRFLEIGVATSDIAASVQFYERLGFSQRMTSDSWPYRYGVLSDGRVHLGLHEHGLASPSVTFVLPDLRDALQPLRDARIEPEQTSFSDDRLHQALLRDPSGNAVTLLEARTYSPSPPGSTAQSVCGYFSHLSLPENDFDAARQFWEQAGFVALAEEDEPFPHMPLTSDHLNLAFHQRRTFDAPLLVFECAEVQATMLRLRALDIALSAHLPRGVDRRNGCLIESQSGPALLLLQAND